MGCYDQNIISCRGYFYFRPQINEVPYFRIGEIMETANEASHDSNTDIYIIDGIHYKVIKTTEDGGEK